MRKTKNLIIALKGLFLVCALCLLTATQSNAQSVNPDTHTSPTNQTIIWENTFDFNGWSFFQWLQNIVTTDIIRRQNPAEDKPNSIPTNTSKKKHMTFSTGTLNIVTDDMSIRDAGDGDGN